MMISGKPKVKTADEEREEREKRMQKMLITVTDGHIPRKHLGEGAYAHVYEGIYQDKPVAIKLVGVSTDHQYEILVNMHIQEVHKASKSSQLPITTPFFGYSNANPYYYKMVFMLMDMTLTSFINSKHYNDQAILKYLSDIIIALEFLHTEANVTWCDGKPDNVLLKDNQAYISDLGFAFEGETRHAGMAGTPIYTAPEILTCKNLNNYASDIWALGLIMYEAITQIEPFKQLDQSSLSAYAKAVDALTEPVFTFKDDEKTKQPLLTKLSLLACVPKPEERPTAHELACKIRPPNS